MDTSGWKMVEVPWASAKPDTVYHCPSAGIHVATKEAGVLLVPSHLLDLVAKDLWGADPERQEVLIPAPDLQAPETPPL